MLLFDLQRVWLQSTAFSNKSHRKNFVWKRGCSIKTHEKKTNSLNLIIHELLLESIVAEISTVEKTHFIYL